jgi:hypothetical protein
LMIFLVCTRHPPDFGIFADNTGCYRDFHPTTSISRFEMFPPANTWAQALAVSIAEAIADG